MKSANLTRSLLLSGVCSLALFVRPVSADAIVIASSVDASAFAIVFFADGGISVSIGVIDACSGCTLSNSVAVASGDVDAEASYRVSTVMTGTKVSSHANVSATVSQSTSGDFVGRGAANVHTENFFLLTQPHRYTYTISSSFTQGHGGDFGWSFLNLIDEASESAFPIVFSPFSPGAFTRRFSGILKPGLYDVGAQASIDHTASFGPRARGEFDFAFDLAPAVVPEPGTLILLGTGLVALCRCRKRRGSQS